MANKRKAILVLGMHRSGTSAITRVLNLIGLALPSRIMPAVPDNNEAGFWESSEIASIHDRLLAEVHSAWDDCLRFPASFFGSETAESFSAEILEILEKDFGEVPEFVIKDPRISRFLPFWLDLLQQFDADPHLVLISRHPLEVAASLRRRDHFPEAKSLHLWLRHLLDMEKDSRGLKRSLITYGALLNDWRATVEKMARDLQTRWPRASNDAAEEIDGFLSNALRHHRVQEAESLASPELYQWVGEAHRAYLQAVGKGRSVKRTFDKIARRLDAAEEVFAPSMSVVQEEINQLRSEYVLSVDRRIIELTKAHANAQKIYETEIAKLRSLLEVSDAKVYEQQEVLEDLMQKHGELESHRDLLQSERDELNRELRDTRKDRDWLWERLNAVQTSKVGRVIWRQWTSYLALRGALLSMRDRLTGGQPGSDTGSRGAMSKIGVLLKAPLRLVTKGMGWVFLLCNVVWEQILAAARRAFRRSDNKQLATARALVRSRLPRVLLLSPYPIYPPHHGGGVRLYNLIRRLAQRCELHLLIFSNSGEDPEQREALSLWARSVSFHHWHPSFESGWWHLQPPNAALFSSDEVARQVAHLLVTHRIDILQLEYTELGQYGLPKFANVKTVLTEHDLAFRQHRRRRKMGFHHKFPEGNAYGSTFGDWLRLIRYELAVCRRADQIHVMSEDDGQVLSGYLGDAWERIRVVPNAVDTAYYDPAAVADTRSDVLYVGNFQNLPNVDALEYLVEEIWPLVRSRHPEIGLTVVGAHPSDRVTRYHDQDGVDVVGAVPDLRPYYHGHRLMVAPIRAGSGTRLKILEAFAAGLPVVSTTLGAEGIEAVPEEHLLLADDPQGLAARITDLLENDDLCNRLSTNGLALVKETYDWQRSAEATLRGWDELLAGQNDWDRRSPEPLPLASTTDSDERSVDVSIVIPTFRGGEKLSQCLEAIANQTTDLSREIICVDSGSDEADLATMREHDVRIESIEQSDFDHGLTRDLGATVSQGRILVFLNQDAIPCDDLWLSRLTKPFFENEHCAAVQGGIREMPDPEDRFFWDSCGERFYFTRESDRWIERYYGIGFSTVNAAIRHRIWKRYPFGRAPIMEDKKWQKQVVDDGNVIRVEHEAAVTHTHNYELRSLWRRCLSEGFGWRLVGERYSLFDMVRDGLQFRVHKDLVRGLTAGKIRSSAELFFPWLRPLALYWGNHWSRSVKL